MHRIDGPTAAPGGLWTEGDPVGGVPATIVSAAWMNDTQENLIAVLVAAGITPVKGNYAQLLAALPVISGHGQCRLSVGSTTTLVLSPFNGRNVIVNGVPLQLPTGGVTYTIGALAASTVYYVYLSGTTAAPVLNVSTTAYATGTNGVTVKSGDATQTLVGMVRTNASTQFVDSITSRTCINWFNRRKVVATTANTGPFSFTNTTLAETSTLIRVPFLVWADDVPIVNVSSGTTQTSGSPAITKINFQVFMDGISTAYSPATASVIQPTYDLTISTHGALGGLSEGYHFATLGTYVGPNGGTLNINNIQATVNING